MLEEQNDGKAQVYALLSGMTESVDGARRAVFNAEATIEHAAAVARNWEISAAAVRAGAVAHTVDLQELAERYAALEAKAKRAFDAVAALGGH